jgi:hypothetical protein
MLCLRSSVVLVAVVVALSCGGSPQPAPGALSSRWSSPSILSHVPAESPYVFATLEPINEALRRRLMDSVDQQIAKARELLDRQGDERPRKPLHRAIGAMLDELRGRDWIERLGLDPRGRFALYGLSLWPAMRMEIANPAKLRAAIQRIFAAAEVKPEERTLDGRAYWVFGDKDFTAVTAVTDREWVAAVAPTAVLDAALPLVLGTKLPAHPLAATSTVPELLGRHRFLGFLVGYIDAHNIVNVLTGPEPGPLDIPIRAATGQVAPTCRADLDRLAAAIPRLVVGYHRLDDAGFDSSFVVELPPSTIGGMRKLRTAVPEVTARPTAHPHPTMAFGAALDLGEAISWATGVTRGIHDQPFTCPWFTGINDASNEIGDKLATPLPPAWRGMRGISVALDDATLSPPSITGHVVVAGERVADLVGSLAGSIPAIAGIPLAHDGRPIALPAQQLNLPARSAHLALTTDRLVIAAGDGSERRVAEHLASPAPKASPLMTMSFDIPRLQRLLAAFGQAAAAQSFGPIREIGTTIDVDDLGVRFDLWGTWPAAAQIAAPPAAPPHP